MKHRFQEREQPVFSLRFRLILLVACELVVSIILATWLARFIDRYLLTAWDIPFTVYLVVVSLAVGIVVTALLSRLFFAPIKKLRLAMSRVAAGDFTTKIHTKSHSQEVREIYAGFNLMTEELRSTEVLQTDFVFNVSHEFKTPLSAIEGYSTLLQDGDNLTDQQREYVEKIIFNTQRLSTLTGSILLLSKLENQQIPTGKTRFSLDEQIRQTIVAMETVWERKDIELDVELDTVFYYGNEMLLRHVWSNLLSNAIKFSPQGGTVEIGLTREKDTVKFWIKDCGPGIPDEAMQHIFSRFYQADSSHKQEGSGLGLAMVDKILRLEDGRIAVENCAAGGCQFTVYLQNT